MRTHRTRRTARVAALGALTLVLTSCASLGGGSTGGDGSSGDGLPGSGGDGSSAAHVPGGPDDVLVRVSHQGGFVPLGWDFSTVADVTVYADGLAVVPGPTTLEYPGRLLPNLQTYRLSDEAVRAIVTAAEDAGLLGAAPEYGMPAITDVGSTLVTVGVDGTSHAHDAYALEIARDTDGDVAGLTEEHLAAREALAGFVDAVRAAVGSAEEAGPYAPDAYAVMARPADAAAEVEPAPAEIAWPLAVPLTGADCVVVDGEDAAALGPVLADARQGDRFVQDGVAHDVWVRVLLPGDPGCTGTESAPAGG